MPNCESLPWYGILVIIVTGCAVLIPYMRHRAELVSAWNILLFGVAISYGVGLYQSFLVDDVARAQQLARSLNIDVSVCDFCLPLYRDQRATDVQYYLRG